MFYIFSVLLQKSNIFACWVSFSLTYSPAHTNVCVCVSISWPCFWCRTVGFFFFSVVVLVLNLRLFTYAIENIGDHYHQRNQHCHRHHYHHHRCQCYRHSHRHQRQYYWRVSVFLLFKRNDFFPFFSLFCVCVCVCVCESIPWSKYANETPTKEEEHFATTLVNNG